MNGAPTNISEYKFLNSDTNDFDKNPKSVYFK